MAEGGSHEEHSQLSLNLSDVEEEIKTLALDNNYVKDSSYASASDSVLPPGTKTFLY